METLVYAEGEILARVTTPAEAADGLALRRLLEKQHWELVQQVRHGLLDDEPEPELSYALLPLQQRIEAIKTVLFEPVDLQQWRDACAKRMALVLRW